MISGRFGLGANFQGYNPRRFEPESIRLAGRSALMFLDTDDRSPGLLSAEREVLRE